MNVKNCFFSFCLLISCSAYPGVEKRKKTICLNMIVKNEKNTILHCLASVKDKIDYWVIADTGSNDGTQQLIRDFMKEIPGELHERPWVDFAHNRNEVLALAKNKGEYSLFIDADEVLEFSDLFALSHLDKDYYFIRIREPNNIEYLRIGLIDNRLDWNWVGVLHEDLECKKAKNFEILSGVVNLSDSLKGCRSQDPQKYLKDAQVLERELTKDPNNGRNQLFLALSYQNAKEFPLALKNFEKRASMAGSEEEVFYSKFRVAQLYEILGKPSQSAANSYLEAYRFRPTRAEPLFYLGKLYIRERNYKKGYETLKLAAPIKMPGDRIFVERWIYEWGIKFFLAECCYQLGKNSELKAIFEELLRCESLPSDKKEKIRKSQSILSSASF